MHSLSTLVSSSFSSARAALQSHQQVVQAPTIMAKAGYVRREKLAGEYHTADFDWEEHKQEVSHIVHNQESLAAQHSGPSDTSVTKTGSSQTNTNRTVKSSDLRQSQGKVEEDEENKWEKFYAGTARSAKFFRERRYLLLEFPLLNTQEPQHVVELGCGYGPSLLPILRTNPQARVTATDIAPTCVAQLSEVAAREGIQDYGTRITAFVADSASAQEVHRFRGIDGDVALIMFTLSAVDLEGQANMLRNAWESLKPGGHLCIRDHGLYDMVQLRIPAEQWIAPNMYRRGDGTLAYFYSIEDLSSKAETAGFNVVECSYVTVFNKNRKTGQNLKRVFIHGLFQKPV